MRPATSTSSVHCSRCDARQVVPIVWGHPSPEILDEARRREIAMGGCVVGPQEWACLACGYTWPLPPEALGDPVRHALEIAYQAHYGQTRKGDGGPYVDHVIEVAHMLYEAGCDPHVVAAGLLHDAVEDSDLTAGEIADEVGAVVATLVEALTERKDVSDYERRKLEHRVRVAGSGRRATAIFAADRLANLRALRRSYAEQGEAVGRHFNASLDEKLAQLHRDVRMLKRVDSSNPSLGDLASEMASFRAERAARRCRRR